MLISISCVEESVLDNLVLAFSPFLRPDQCKQHVASVTTLKVNLCIASVSYLLDGCRYASLLQLLVHEGPVAFIKVLCLVWFLPKDKLKSFFFMY